MPYATVYRYNRIALDTNTMGNSIDVEKNISSVVPTQGALVRANFDTRIGVRALITVTGAENRCRLDHWYGKTVPE